MWQSSLRLAPHVLGMSQHMGAAQILVAVVDREKSDRSKRPWLTKWSNARVKGKYESIGSMPATSIPCRKERSVHMSGIDEIIIDVCLSPLWISGVALGRVVARRARQNIRLAIRATAVGAQGRVEHYVHCGQEGLNGVVGSAGWPAVGTTDAPEEEATHTGTAEENGKWEEASGTFR